MTYTARTLCGCARTVEVKYLAPFLEVPLEDGRSRLFKLVNHTRRGLEYVEFKTTGRKRKMFSLRGLR
jgi:hypothetical protein